MKVTDLPGVAVERYVGLQEHTERVRSAASLAALRVSELRDICNGRAKATGKEVAKAQAELPEALKAEKATRGLADQAFAVWSKVKTWVERNDAEVEPIVPPRANGVDLTECRNKKLAVIDQLAKLRSLPAPSDRALVETFIAELGRPAEQQVAEMLRRWPHFASAEHLRMGMDRDVLPALQTVMARDAMVDFLCERIDAAAAAAMPVSDRPDRIKQLEAEMTALMALETTLVWARVEVDDSAVTFDPATPVPLILSINVVQQETKLAS